MTTTNTLTYGFADLQQLANERIENLPAGRLFSAVQESAAEYSRGVNELLASFVQRTTLYKQRFVLPGTGTLQPLDENGVPKPVLESGYYDVAFPIQGGGTAWGSNRVARALMTVDEANRQTLESMKRDQDWLRRHIFGALFYNSSWTFSDKEHGNLTIEPLANADSVTYVRVGGAASTDNHYLYQAAAIADAANPYDDIYEELMEHPSNSGPVVVYIPTALVAATKALSSFHEVGDNDIRKGSASDTVINLIDRGLGDEVLGKTDNCWIVEWRALPSTHMIAHAQGAGPVLAMREYEAASLQGLFAERFNPDSGREQISMIRYAGFGVMNRIAACVYYVGGGSYSAPSGYTTMPLPV